MNVRLLATAIVSLGIASLVGCESPAPKAPTEEEPLDVRMPPRPTPSSAPSAGGPATETPKQGATAMLEGGWVSTSCGARKYTRNLLFDGKGHFKATDLVSPCPPNAKCIWSGIVERSGTYVAEPTRVTLTVDPSQAPAKAGAELPTTLALSPGPTEQLPDGTSCKYERAASAL